MSFYEDPCCVLLGSCASTARECATPSRYDEQRAELTVRKPMEYVGVQALLCEGFTTDLLYPSALISDFRRNIHRRKVLISHFNRIDVVQYHTDHFLEALNIYRCSAKEKGLKDFEISGAHGWDEIMREYEDAQSKYVNKEKGWRGIPRKLTRMAGDHATSIYPFLRFIPQGDYTSPISAGLFLIFGAANRVSERRKQILEALGEIPLTIENAEYAYEDFADDKTMKEEMIELYVSLLIAIMTMMQWLIEKSGWKQIKALIEGPRYGRPLEEVIRDVQKQARSLQRRVEKLTRSAIVTTASSTKKTGLQVDKLSSATETIKANTDATLNSVHELKQDIVHMNLKNQKGMGGLNSLVKILQETFLTAEWNQREWQAETRRRRIEESLRREAESKLELTKAELQRAQSSSRQQGMIVTTTKLLKLLAVDMARIKNEAVTIIRRGRSSDQSVHDRGHLLMQHWTFQAWMASGQSKCLLVDGNAGSAVERVSAMTVVCALLAHSLPNETAGIITYFCGLHTDPADALGGPCGILRAILAQVILDYGVHLGFVDSEEYDDLQRFDLRRLCILLGVSIKKLPAGVVLFCMIDGVSLYEKDGWLEETCYALKTICDLTRDSEVSATFKLLVTSPLASRYMARYVQEGDHLILPRDLRGGSGGPISNRQLMMQSRRMADEDNDSEEIDGMSFDEGFVDGDYDEGNFEDDGAL